MEELKKFTTSVEDLLKLIEDGILVRDISKDDDGQHFIKSSLRLVGKTVSEIEEIERIGTVVTEAEYAGKLINAKYVTVCVKQ